MGGDRDLVWDGVHNVRDLGGLPVGGGRETRRGAVVRADTLDRLTPRGWSDLVAYGVRTVIDLRNDFERAEPTGRPAEVTTRWMPLDDFTDRGLWDHIQHEKLDGTPLYYPLFLERKLERCVAVLMAIADAEPGGVVFHCVTGRDRTGLISLLLLALAGVDREEIIDDYGLSAERVLPVLAALGHDDPRPYLAELYRRKGTSQRAALLATLDAIDEDRLRAAGLGAAERHAVRTRLLGPA